jgi:hypothetical protein
LDPLRPRMVSISERRPVVTSFPYRACPNIYAKRFILLTHSHSLASPARAIPLRAISARDEILSVAYSLYRFPRDRSPLPLSPSTGCSRYRRRSDPRAWSLQTPWRPARAQSQVAPVSPVRQARSERRSGPGVCRGQAARMYGVPGFAVKSEAAGDTGS